jgi:hypothetical protein
MLTGWRNTMAYKLKYKGSVEIECDTVDEAVSIAQRLTSMNGASAELPLPDIISADAGVRVTSSRVQEFIGYLDSDQRKFLALLIDSPHGKTDHNLRQALGISDNRALGGILSGISKLAKKAGLSIGDILSSQWVKVGAERVKEFKAEPGFRHLAQSTGGLK